MNELNFWRQLDVFDPLKFKKQVFVVGCGAIGSHVVDTLIRVGIRNITAIDFDVVEDHNLPNQIFNLAHIGMPKVEAMQEIAKSLGVEIQTINQKVEGLTIRSPSYVILAVDSMNARRLIWNNGIKLNPSARMIEARMAAEHGLIHCINPIDLSHVEFWEANWFPDHEAEESPCTNRAVCTTAKTMASIMVHSLLTWENGQTPPMKALITMRPAAIITR